MVATKQDLMGLSDEAWNRLRRRVEGLTDDEYLWEPAPGCWSIRRRPDGTWRADGVLPSPDPAPPTTIAWRLWHLIDMYGEDRAPRFFAVEPQGPAIGNDDPDGRPPATADAAIRLLEQAHDRWDRHLAAVSDEALRQPMGDVAGPYGEQSRAAFVLHMLDEFVHHGAEVALLRDLWRWQHPITGDALVDRVLRGDLEVVAELAEDQGRRETVLASHPDLLSRAAAYGRWDVVLGLAELGFPVDSEGRTALHLAAGAGEVAVVEALLDHGADPQTTDPVFHATAAGWAAFFDHQELADWLQARTIEG